MADHIQTLTVGPLEVNCYMVGCGVHKVCAVFDPGDEAGRILGAASARGWAITHIINTHGHADHTGASAKIVQATRAKLGILRAEAPLLNHPYTQDLAAYLGLELSPPPDAMYEDGDEVTVCEHLVFKVIATPGHSPGGACYLFSGAVITGDTLFRYSIGRSDLPGGDQAALLRSIRERLMTLPDDTVVYPGHGEPSTIGEERDLNPFVRGVMR